MSPTAKFLIGLVAAIAVTWINFGPLGQGGALVDRMERDARAVVANTGLDDVTVSFGRSPLTRLATLSGPANRFQREGMGSLKGINERVNAIDGVSGVRWTDEPEQSAIPLIIESLIPVLLAYLIGIGLGWLFWGRKRREGFY